MLKGRFLLRLSGWFWLALVGAMAAAGSAMAADLGSKCCADLEERVAELEDTVARRSARLGKSELKITGAVSRALLYWDDGGRRDVFVVDDSNSGTALDIEYDVEIGGGWKVGLKLGFDLLQGPSDAVDQFDPGAVGSTLPQNSITREGLPSGIFIADSYWFIENEKSFGSFQLGYTDTASDKIDNINLSGSDTLADADVINWNGKFFLRAANGSLLDLRWDDFIDGTFMGGTIAGMNYTSRVIHGFEFSAAWGEDDYWDVALRYNADWGKHLRVAAGFGYFNNTTEDFGDLVPKQDQGLGGSIALLHIPTGLNIAFNHAYQSHTKNCDVLGAEAAGPGAVSGKCRGPDRFTYVKGGLIKKLFDFGPTAFYGEYFWTKKEFNESDPDVLSALDDTGTAQELKNSTARVWGFGVVQKFDDVEPLEKKSKKAKNGGGEGNGGGGNGETKKRAKKDDTPLEIYIGYRHYEVDYNLIGDAGPVAGKKIKDFDAVISGVTIRF